MMVATGDTLSDIASSDDEENGEDDDDEVTKLCNPTKVDKPGWVMGTITEMVQQHMERFRQK
jgi:hypothetical protein